LINYISASTQDSNEIPTAMPMLYESNYQNVVKLNGKKPEVENPRWRPLNRKYLYFRSCLRAEIYVFPVCIMSVVNLLTILMTGSLSQMFSQTPALKSLIIVL